MDYSNDYTRTTGRSNCLTTNKGIRIMPAKKRKKLTFSIQRLRVKIADFFRLLKRWRSRLCPYCFILTQKPTKLMSEEIGWRSRSLSSSSRMLPVYPGASGDYSFYSDAIADCLEFIKRSSISVDENTGGMSLADVH